MMLNIFKESGVTFTLDAGNLLKVDGLKTIPTGKADEIREHIRQHRAEIVRELVQDQFNDLWSRAWALADTIDDHQGGVDIEIRRSMLPELNRMRSELSRLERAGAFCHQEKQN